MDKIYDLVNGSFILKDKHRNKIIELLQAAYTPGTGNGKFHAVKYLIAEGIQMPIAHMTVNSVDKELSNK